MGPDWFEPTDLRNTGLFRIARGQDIAPQQRLAKGSDVANVTGPLAIFAQEVKWRRDAVDRAEKTEMVSVLGDVFNASGSVVVAHYAGLTVAQMTALRNQMRDQGASVKVAKNRLAKLALKGTDAAEMADLFQGPTLIAYADDPVAAPKVASEFAKTNDKLVILGGTMGATALDASGVKALASMPSLDELRAKLVGMINTPATRIAQVINAPAGQLARVFGAYASKDEAA